MKTDPRYYTKKLLTQVLEGEVESQHLIRDLLNWMSEDDVKEFADCNYYYTEEDEE